MQNEIVAVHNRHPLFMQVTIGPKKTMLLNAYPHTSASKAFFESQLAACNDYLLDIKSSTSAVAGQVAGAKILAALNQVSALVDGIARSAPRGSENAIAALKLSVANAHVSYEQASRVPRQTGAGHCDCA